MHVYTDCKDTSPLLAPKMVAHDVQYCIYIYTLKPYNQNDKSGDPQDKS